jgi:hypothetical protein
MIVLYQIKQAMVHKISSESYDLTWSIDSIFIDQSTEVILHSKSLKSKGNIKQYPYLKYIYISPPNKRVQICFRNVATQFIESKAATSLLYINVYYTSYTENLLSSIH